MHVTKSIFFVALLVRRRNESVKSRLIGPCGVLHFPLRGGGGTIIITIIIFVTT
jgi:hypothetical protein